MTPDRERINRRTMLRGAGVAMALPWLESIPVWGGEAGRRRAAFPRRFAALFMGNGISPHHWWAKGSGSAMELSKSLQPLAPFADRLNVITGLFNKQATGVGIHPGQTGNILSGAALQKGAVLQGGVSMDQVLAGRLGEETPQPSLVLGCEQPITGYHETNFSMAYSSHISWQDALSPVPMEVYPSLAFDSLFDNQGSKRTLSILDRVKEHAAELSRQVSHADRAKLDEYLTSVREVEKRVERTRAMKDRADDRASARGRPALAMPRPDNGLPEDIREHMRLMCDIIALAFQTDKTRVATLLLCRDLSGSVLPVPRRPHGAPSGLAQRPVRRLRARVALLREPARLSRRPARRDAGGRAHRARQLVPDVHLEHVVRAASTTRPRCPCSWSAAWAGRSRPAASSTTPGAATRTASCAACTSRSWTAWA